MISLKKSSKSAISSGVLVLVGLYNAGRKYFFVEINNNNNIKEKDRNKICNICKKWLKVSIVVSNQKIIVYLIRCK